MNVRFCAVIWAAATVWAGDWEAAQLAYDRTRYDEALKILNQMKDATGPVLALRGKSYFMQNDFKRASELLEQAVQREPRSSHHYLWLGRAYGRRAETSSVFTAPGHASKARQALERSVELNAKNGDALNDLFEYYLQAPGFLGGGMDKAAGLIEKIAALDPAERHYAQFRLAEEKKDWKLAESQLRRAADLAPQQVGRLVDLAKFLARRGRMPESEVALAKAEKIDPNSPKVWIERAEIYINAGQHLPEARKLLQKYLSAGHLTPDDRPKEDARKLLAKIS